MSALPPIDDLIVLYTVSNLSPARIAQRYGADVAAVRAALVGAGVSVRPAIDPPSWRNSLEAADERAQGRVAPPAPTLRPGEDPDLKHCLAVLRANGGCGFPFGVRP